MPRNEKAPAFQVYAADDLADAQMMTDEQFGKWNRLRALAWRDMGLPTDPEQLAAILRVKAKDFAKLWAIVGVQFVERAGRYVLPWQEKQREKHAQLRERNATNGQHGGRPPKPPENPPPNPDGTHRVPKEEAKAKPDESSSSFSLLGSEKILPPSSGASVREIRPTAAATELPLPVALAVAANQAVTDVWGESPQPYLGTGTQALALADRIGRAEIPPAFAVRAVFTTCRAFCEAAKSRGDPKRRPGGLSYFGPAVDEAWAAAQASALAASTPAVTPLPDVKGFATPDPWAAVKRLAEGKVA